MTEAFRDCFVGDKGYDVLKILMKGGNEFCIDFAKCLQDRSDSEIAYAKNLRKTSDTLQKLAGRAKGSLAQALTTLSTETSKEKDAHTAIASALLNDIAIPMRNLAEAQNKDRKSIEETLNGKFKEWNAEKDNDAKYRFRQFDKSKEIEILNLKIAEMSKTIKTSARDTAKEKTLSKPLVTSCVFSGRRHTSNSDKSTSTSDVKYQANMETAVRKAEEDLEDIERKYRLATRNVETARQACDIEMRRSCDLMEKMEFERISEMEKFIHIYANSMQAFNETMHQVSQDLFAIQIIPRNDIITEARSNLQTPETEILLYDIYAENRDNVMNEQRRILSLMHWMELLRKDIEIQRQLNNASFSSLTSASSHKSVKDESPDDDRGSSNDGAMCSTSSYSKKDIVVKAADRLRDESSSSSNDDDGAMRRGKCKNREKKKTEGVEKFSSESFIDRRGAQLLQCLYEASLYKIESAYNRIKQLPEPQYEYARLITGNINDKGCPTKFLRLPLQPSTHTPPSAPSTAKYFATAMPMFVQPTQQQPVLYPIQTQAPPVGWAVNNVQMEHTVVPDNQMVASAPVMKKSVELPPQKRDKHVRARYPYKARRTDELNLEPDDIIILLESRPDGWCTGNSHGKIGLFPRNYVEDV